MAAETLTATRAASTFPVAKPIGAGVLCCAYGSYDIAAAVEDGDIFQMCRVPAGAVIVGGHVYADDLDTGTETLDMDIGWAANGGSGTYDAADPDGLGNLGVWTGDVFAAGNVANVVGIHYPLAGKLLEGELPTFTRETVIQIEANAAGNAGHTGTVSVVVFYVVP
jgi:hypothetical protein